MAQKLPKLPKIAQKLTKIDPKMTQNNSTDISAASATFCISDNDWPWNSGIECNQNMLNLILPSFIFWSLATNKYIHSRSLSISTPVFEISSLPRVNYPKFIKELGEEPTWFRATVSSWDTGWCPTKGFSNDDCSPPPRMCCWSRKILPIAVAGGDPTLPKLGVVGEGPKLVKETVCPWFCPWFWPNMVKAWLFCPGCRRCCPNEVKAWLRCKLVPKEVKAPVVLPTWVKPCPRLKKSFVILAMLIFNESIKNTIQCSK